ncbi:MAG: hypothetical protein LUF85_15980 [Bacteroides sp.]|nr:hypothetical protein [Bacteroides sp.]
MENSLRSGLLLFLQDQVGMAAFLYFAAYVYFVVPRVEHDIVQFFQYAFYLIGGTDHHSEDGIEDKGD